MRYEYKCFTCGAKLSYQPYALEPIADYFDCPVGKKDKMELLANRHLSGSCSRPDEAQAFNRFDSKFKNGEPKPFLF